MEEVTSDQLVPGKIYLLKWSSQNKNGTVDIVILECEFIHHYDNQYSDAYVNLNTQGDFDASLTGNILDEQGFVIPHPFDHPLHPYSDIKFFTRSNIEGIGLFRVISLFSTTFNGVTSNKEHGLKNNKYDRNPYTLTQLVFSTKIDTGNKIKMGETLMWVNLDRVKIIKPIKEKVLKLQGEAVDAWMSQVTDVTRDPTGIAETVKTYLGRPTGMGRKGKTRRKKGRKSKGKSKKNRSRRTRKMKGGNDLIKNEAELKNSWDKKERETDRFLIQSWLANDGKGTMGRYFREGMTYEDLKGKLNYYLKNMNTEGYIKEEYY
jgi:hypothetical protein